MNSLFLKKYQKEKYYEDFKIENNKLIQKLNLFSAIVCIFINSIIIINELILPDIFPEVVYLYMPTRFPLIIIGFLILISYVIKPLKKFNIIFGYLLALSVLIFSANLMIVSKYEPMLLNTWIMLIIIIVGLYPILVVQSIIIFLISIIYYTISNYNNIHLSDRNLQVIFINTIIAAIISAIFKFFFMRARQREFYAKKDLEKANKALEIANKEIKDLNEKLQSFDKIKTDFFSNISHEIRTPLTLITTPIESYFDGKMKINNMNEFLFDIQKNSIRLSNLINNLLDFSKLDAGRMNLTIKETDIEKFLQNYIYSFKTSTELKGITLEFFNLSRNLKIYIDQNKIDKVFMNLFSNAMKFTNPCGKITVKLKNDDNYCYIEFTDTGPGIPIQMKDAVFERFRQVDSDLNRGHEGSGIGLALVKEYMTMHGGKITLESKYFKDYPDDHGTIFTLIFLIGKKHFEKLNNIEIIFDKSIADLNDPIKQIDVSETEYHSKEKNLRDYSNYSKPTVLVVEDNPEMANLICDILSKEYNIVITKNGKEAIDKLNSMKIDLVLSDIMMPEMDGYTMLKTIRLNKQFNRLPIIMLTAKTDDKMKINSLENGANDYLTKPFSARELLAKINTQIHLKLFMDKLINIIDKKNISEVTKKKLEYTIEFINNNYLDIISRENLAATLDMSPDHFSRMFKQYTGKKVLDYINDLRISYAAKLLITTDKKVIDIAMDTGFETLRTFNRDFIKKMNMSPSEYRLK